MLCTQAVLPDMKAAKWGRIVNIASPPPNRGGQYDTLLHSRARSSTMTRSDGQEFGPHGRHGQHIPPGTVYGTIMSEANRDRSPRPVEELIGSIPVRRTGEPSDIANGCAYCARTARACDGQILGIKRGRVVT